ncbi:hypothetical protein FKL62_26305 [Klebsiella pneumoniae]|nr:hypothetical protein [Klebsiella pneumoniae]
MRDLILQLSKSSIYSTKLPRMQIALFFAGQLFCYSTNGASVSTEKEFYIFSVKRRFFHRCKMASPRHFSPVA